jgi:hypothetical protein
LESLVPTSFHWETRWCRLLRCSSYPCCDLKSNCHNEKRITNQFYFQLVWTLTNFIVFLGKPYSFCF